MKSWNNWMNKAYAEACKLSDRDDIKFKDMPKWVKFRIRLMCFIWDWVSWDAVKNGWPMPRMQYKSWKFYRKHPYLKK